MQRLSWTGNPIVDTGLAVAVVRAGKQSPDEMSIADFQDVIGDGQWLVDANSKLNAYVALFANGFLNRSNKKAMDDGTEQGKYKRILIELKNHLSNTTIDNQLVCECTGEFPAANQFLRELTVRLRQEGVLKDSQNLDLGRNAFPLLGSLGNDAGALPAASREPRVSAFAMLCAQLAPLAAVMLKGKVAFFQYTEPSLLLIHVDRVYRETLGKVQTASAGSKIGGIGQGEGTARTARLLIDNARILLDEFFKLKRHRRLSELPESVALNLWLVLNSGTKVDSDLIEIPNHSLQLLWQLADQHFKEVDDLLKREGKKWTEQLLQCVTMKLDYDLLYSKKGNKPATKELFALYQTNVFERPRITLQVAEWIAACLKARVRDKKDRKQLEEYTKYLGESKDSKRLRPTLKRTFVELAEEGLLNYESYSALFPIEQLQPMRVATFGWKYLWFYLNHDELSAEQPQFTEEDLMQIDNEFRHEIRRFARDVFAYYVEKYGLEKFQKRILEGFRNNRIRVADLQRWFINLGELKPGYTNDDWDRLCRDEYSVNRVGEVVFQLRLELANLYRANSAMAQEINQAKGE